MNITSMWSEEIKTELEELKKMEVGTEQYKVAVEGITKLMDRELEMQKLDMEAIARVRDREFDQELKEKQFKDEKKDRNIKNVLTAVSVVGGFALTVWGTITSMKFEKEDTFTTIMGRGFINKLLPKK